MTHPDAMRELALRARRSGETIGFVPTMGALHDGHAALLARARGEIRRLAVSVFVNPLQFGPKEDFARYPRNDLNDARICRGEGVDWLYMPTADQMYPQGFSTQVTPGPMGDEYEGAVRRGHFTGVLTVVLKLLETVRPHTLYLGQKDAQQAFLVGRMIRDLDIPVYLSVAPTVRERDGLAYSSRNAYLTPEERLRARGLPRALKAGRERARKGATVRAILAEARKTLQKESKPDRIDYLAVVDPRTFEPLTRLDSRGLLIAAARIGRTRLIDNMTLSAPRS
ncbi:MAG TPA: pantoate--beta-alanine ligase [Candidatus Eisenbacteria bacterium]|nr:pantoate--beta-alanine ligase [Candidatus Eisenbacteria bacterium]